MWIGCAADVGTDLIEFVDHPRQKIDRCPYYYLFGA